MSEKDADLLTRLERIFRISLGARRLDERLWVLVRAGKGPFIISGQGHEVPQGIITSFLQPTDWLVPYYRYQPKKLCQKPSLHCWYDYRNL